MFEVRRVKVMPDGEIVDYPNEVIEHPCMEMFAVCEVGSSTNSYIGLYPSIEKASSACRYFEEEAKEKIRNDKKIKDLEKRILNLEVKIKEQHSENNLKI